MNFAKFPGTPFLQSTEVLIFRISRLQMFFKIGALKNLAVFTGKHLCWPLHAFFYRTPIVTASTFSRQQILFSGEPGIYCWPSHRYLLRTPSKTRLKPQKQPLELFCKKGILRSFANFTGKHLRWNLFLIELQKVCSFMKKRLRHKRFPKEFTKFLRTPSLKIVNDCFWNLFFNLSCLFSNLTSDTN